MDRVELPLEVWVLRGSVEGGPVGPGKELNGAGRLIPVSQNSRNAVTAAPKLARYTGTKARGWRWPTPPTR